MLALQYPWKYASVFEELCDFHVLDLAQGPSGWAEAVNSDKAVWLDSSSLASPPEGCDEYSAVILPYFPDAGVNLLRCQNNYVKGTTNVGLWKNDRRFLRLMTEAVDMIALHWTSHRNLHISPEEACLYHAYEFCNLDELRRYPFRSLHTSVPVTAALYGIDLRLRERRPKNLPLFSYGLHLNDAQLELAYNNAKAIKEAMEHARCNNTLHT